MWIIELAMFRPGLKKKKKEEESGTESLVQDLADAHYYPV